MANWSDFYDFYDEGWDLDYRRDYYSYKGDFDYDDTFCSKKRKNRKKRDYDDTFCSKKRKNRKKKDYDDTYGEGISDCYSYEQWGYEDPNDCYGYEVEYWDHDDDTHPDVAIDCYGYVSKSQADSPCHQVAQETDNATSQEKLDNDDDASADGTDDDYVRNEECSGDDYDDDVDAFEESSDDDASQEDKVDDASQRDKDDDASSPVVNDDGGSSISPLNQSNALEDLSLEEENHCIRRNTVVAVGETDQVSNGENDGAVLNEDVDDEASSFVLNDSARNASTIDQVLSLEDASQTMETRVRGLNTLASVVTETCDNVIMEIQPVKETMDINGFEVVSSKVESVRRIFERHPDISVEFRAKNQHLRNACMNFLLSLIETMCQSLEELSNEDLVESDIALHYLRDAGFKVDWLEKKLNQLQEKKEEEQSGLARLHEIEEKLTILEKKWAELDALADKELKELKATRSALSFDDIVC